MSGKIPATVITGFLGAGKTTLIRHVLRHALGRRLALIINEFGDVGIDGELLRGCGDAICGEGNIIELANGCICCTVADEFLPAMQGLIGQSKPPDHIVIETSGLALPKPLVQAFQWPEIRTRVTVDGVIAVVDAAAVAAERFAADPAMMAAQRAQDAALAHDNPIAELFEDQLACADMVVLSKSDLLDRDEHAGVVARIRGHIRPEVKVVTVRHGQVGVRILLGLGAAAENDLHRRPSHHDNEAEHDHDEFTSFSLILPEASSPEALIDRLKPIVAAHDVLRIKGFAAITGRPMRLVLQGVGARLQHYFDREWHADERRESRFVIIGQRGLDETAIRVALGG